MLSVVLAATLLAVGGLVGATFVRSPAQLAADSEPPPPTLLTAKVARQEISETVIFRGVVTAAHELDVTSAAGSPEGAQPVVTAVNTADGKSVAAGKVLVEVSGRPVFALPGDSPAYRDLRPGSTGDDVAMLQAALQSMGLSTNGDTDGHFGAKTKNAVRQLYERSGFQPPTTASADGSQGDTLQGANEAVVHAERQLRDAREAADSGHAVADATEDLLAAKKRLSELDARTGEMMPASEVIFVPAFPATAHKVSVQAGDKLDDIDGPLLTLSAGELQVVGGLEPADRALVRTGLAVDIDSDVTGFHTTGKVSAVAETPDLAPPGEEEAGDDAMAGQLAVTVTPDTELDPELLGQDIRLTARSAASAKEVHAVPLAAVTSSADGRTYVTKIVPNGQRVRVEIRTGASGDGMVEVDPVGQALGVGDLVVTGE